MKRARRWTHKELELLISAKHESDAVLLGLFPDRHLDKIHYRLAVLRRNQYKINTKPRKKHSGSWLDKEIALLSENIDKPLKTLCKLFPQRTKTSVVLKRSRIKRYGEHNINSPDTAWTKKEEDKLLQRWFDKPTTIKEVVRHTNDAQARKQLRLKRANKIQDNCRLPDWSKEEDSILLAVSKKHKAKRLSKETWEGLLKDLPLRSVEAIRSRKFKLLHK